MSDQERAKLRQAAAVNRHYAARCEETYAQTGRPSALYMAEVHQAQAERKEARASS